MDDEKKEKRKEIFEKIFKKIEKAQKNEKIMQEVLRYKYIAIVFFSILCLLFFQIWTSKPPVYEGHLELKPLIAENELIEIDINQQILAQKAEEIGVKPLNNPEIADYLNLYLQKGTIIWEFETNNQTTYNGLDVIVKAIKLQNGSTVFTINNIQYYIKE